MLFNAERSAAFPDRKEIYESTKALFFLGTPHRGSDWAQWGEIARVLVNVIFDTNSQLIKDLEVYGRRLTELQDHFVNLLYHRTFYVYTFTEAQDFKPYLLLKSKVSVYIGPHLLLEH